MNIQKKIEQAERHLAFLKEVADATKHLDIMLSLPKDAIEHLKETKPELVAKLALQLNESLETQTQAGQLFSIEACGKLDSRGLPDFDAGIVLTSGSRVIVIDPKKGESIDCGYFLDCFSTTTSEEFMLDAWQEYFGG